MIPDSASRSNALGAAKQVSGREGLLPRRPDSVRAEYRCNEEIPGRVAAPIPLHPGINILSGFTAWNSSAMNDSGQIHSKLELDEERIGIGVDEAIALPAGTRVRACRDSWRTRMRTSRAQSTPRHRAAEAHLEADRRIVGTARGRAELTRLPDPRDADRGDAQQTGTQHALEQAVVIEQSVVRLHAGDVSDRGNRKQ